MAKTAKERQEAYRKRRPHAGTDGNGEHRLNTWIAQRLRWHWTGYQIVTA
jgi:hypothetical protein